MKRFFLVLAACFLLGACRSDRQHRDIEHVQLQAVDSSSFFIGLGVRMASYKDYLFVHDFFGEDGFISVADPLKKDSVLFSFLKQGGGPDEVVSFAGWTCFPGTGAFCSGFSMSTPKSTALTPWTASWPTEHCPIPFLRETWTYLM